LTSIFIEERGFVIRNALNAPGGPSITNHQLAEGGSTLSTAPNVSSVST
jgi:hypothetical protein